MIISWRYVLLEQSRGSQLSGCCKEKLHLCSGWFCSPFSWQHDPLGTSDYIRLPGCLVNDVRWHTSCACLSTNLLFHMLRVVGLIQALRLLFRRDYFICTWTTAIPRTPSTAANTCEQKRRLRNTKHRKVHRTEHRLNRSDAFGVLFDRSISIESRKRVGAIVSNSASQCTPSLRAMSSSWNQLARSAV